MSFLRLAISALAVSACLLGCASPETAIIDTNSTNIASLSELSIETLRNRTYQADLKVESKIDKPCADPLKVKAAAKAKGTYKSYMASYMSDGLRVYTRVNIPDGVAPEGGFPVIIFAHGWVGAENAPSYTLGCDLASMYSEVTDAYARAGFMVFVPGYRGHASVDGIPGEGIEFLHAWDNGTYLSTQFYAVDVLNLMAGLSGTLDSDKFPAPVFYQTNDFYLSGHSQGGDVALTILAATGEGAKNGLEISKASIWSGAIAARTEQMQFFNPMEKTPEAFLSGDGTWNGTAVGTDGSINSNFVFGYPPEWIETLDVKAWTWQKDSWKYDSVKDALTPRLNDIYESFNRQVDNISGAKYTLVQDYNGRVLIKHDAKLQAALNEIGGFDFEQYLTEPLRLHFPDRDYISPPAWNYDLCDRVNMVGGTCTPFEYPQNNHGMRVSKHKWFSGDGAVSGYAPMVERDIAFFKGESDTHITFPPTLTPVKKKD